MGPVVQQPWGRTSTRPGLRRLAPVALVIVLAACSSGAPRPSTAEWSPVWEATVALVPSPEDLGEDPSQARCSEVLVELREAQQTAVPTPNSEVDQVVERWLQVASSGFFECFGDGDRESEIAATRATLSRLEDEVAGSLDG